MKAAPPLAFHIFRVKINKNKLPAETCWWWELDWKTPARTKTRQVQLCPHLHPAVSIMTSPSHHLRSAASIGIFPDHPLHPPTSMGSRTALPWGRRFLYGPVSLCGVFGAGTTLTVLGESPTSPRSFLPHHGILTFCRFLAIWGFFSRTWRRAGVCRPFGVRHYARRWGLCVVPEDSDDSVRNTENLGVFS